MKKDLLSLASRFDPVEMMPYPPLDKREGTRLSSEEFAALKEILGNKNASLARFCERNLHCRPVIDPDLIKIVKRLKKDFSIENFVETGTYDGDTSLFFSLIFERVFTCDVIDYERRPEFYFMDNIIYETKSSPEFLKDRLDQIRLHSMFYLDAHWESYWPLRDEMQIVFAHCDSPVLVVDDFDAGNGLFFDSYGGESLNFAYIADFVPDTYKFMLNPRSNRNRGIIFLFPGDVDYGCLFRDRENYVEKTCGLWGKDFVS